VTTLTEPSEKTTFRLLPPYHVILENDPDHTFDFVIGVLVQVLKLAVEKASLLAQETHTTGEAIIWTGSKEVAELLVEQIQTFHETREDGRKLGPVGVRIEASI
jgi:ATP-dependent Clp protease adaptor protein ClpS